MTPTDTIHHLSWSSKGKAFAKGTLAVLPLTIAVIPWGILAGSYAVEAGLSPWQSQAMSAILFAGSAQLVATGMFKLGASLLSILLTTVLITSRHFLYSMAMRPKISPLPLKWRLLLGYLLTDELFAIANKDKGKKFDPWYALGGGLSFYIGWNIASAVGIVAGASIENLDSWGLDFAIAATFIAIVVPNIKQASGLLCVLIALVSSVVCELFAIPGGLLVSALLAMGLATAYAKWRGEAQ
ncbi:AzlC family ABC transporter permease [Agarivorans sp. MS3-6]|uniref:AzlC family ABC transporter permease n=1 Tax=Agarivorans sp. TSD2052 TaxID=2937286 RepID=UPI00200BDB74|nr:AzlC family ABC transporter permease [Agarivorans sp. TSD2052]UPW17285.1 AzlC family ABC transporter permease [Agarivorans sp. TSD2052]